MLAAVVYCGMGRLRGFVSSGLRYRYGTAPSLLFLSLTLSFLSLSFSLSLRGACSPGDMPGFQFTVGRASGTPKKMGGRVSITPAENGQPHSARESSLRHPACPRALLLSTAAFRHALYRSYLSPSSLSQILSLFLSLSPLSWSL